MLTFTLATTKINSTVNSVLHHKTVEKTYNLYNNNGTNKFLESLQEFKVPASNLLMIALGWQGGTIHQVARETGLSVSQILDLDKVQPDMSKDELTPYACGMMYGCTPEHHKHYNGNIQYWSGVVKHIAEYKRNKIDYSKYLQ